MGYLDSINNFAHSFCTNFHKVRCIYLAAIWDSHALGRQWGLTNFDASSLWIRDRKNLTDALDSTPEYLRTKQGDEGTTICSSVTVPHNLIICVRNCNRLSELAFGPRSSFPIVENLVCPSWFWHSRDTEIYPAGMSYIHVPA